MKKGTFSSCPGALQAHSKKIAKRVFCLQKRLNSINHQSHAAEAFARVFAGRVWIEKHRKSGW